LHDDEEVPMTDRRSLFGFSGVVAAASLVAVVVTIGASAHTAAAPNLLKNGGADLGPGVDDASAIVEAIPNWTRVGSFTVVAYGATGGFPDASISKKISGKTNFFAGGPANPKSIVTQVVDVSRSKGAIDAGKRKATLSGFLGGFASQDDSLTATATFLNAAGKPLGALKIGPVSAAQRKGLTALIKKSASKLVPKKTRSIQVRLSAARTSGSYNDGYADNLSVTLAPS
jgi:hypothetical protein